MKSPFFVCWTPIPPEELYCVRCQRMIGKIVRRVEAAARSSQRQEAAELRAALMAVEGVTAAIREE